MSHIPAENLPPTAAIVGGSFINGKSIRIFYRRGDGKLGAVYSDDKGNNWASQIIVQATDKAKSDTPLSLVLFRWDGGQATSRIFFLGPDNSIGWYGVKGGNFDSGKVLLKDGSPVITAPYSKLGSFVWTEKDTPHIRIAYQRPDNTIAQLNWDGSSDFRFTASDATSPATGQGTALAFVNQAPPNTPQYFRGYYEHSNNQLMELINEPNQGYVGTMINGDNTIPPNAVIAASVVPVQNPKQGRISVCWQNAQSGITRCIFNGSWQTPQAVPQVGLLSGGSFTTISYYTKDGDPSSIEERLVWMGQDSKLYTKIL